MTTQQGSVSVCVRDDEASLKFLGWEFNYGWDYRYRHDEDMTDEEVEESYKNEPGWGFWVKTDDGIIFEMPDSVLDPADDCDSPELGLLLGIGRFLKSRDII